MMTKDQSLGTPAAQPWCRIPDGARVKDLTTGQEGLVDGLTEIVNGSNLNPDHLTQYRIDVGTPQRTLTTEENLAILVDDEDLVIMSKQPAEYRRFITLRLRQTREEARFIRRNNKKTSESSKVSSAPANS